ncbi:hypothetical protein R1flu_008828 [Riccia fluitans]|uniref:Uncharacterized protein n=1 Tax=Riccia fluitans TaxID=41844 RepID=A0ABD1Z0D2_9MARC
MLWKKGIGYCGMYSSLENCESASSICNSSSKIKLSVQEGSGRVVRFSDIFTLIILREEVLGALGFPVSLQHSIATYLPFSTGSARRCSLRGTEFQKCDLFESFGGQDSREPYSREPHGYGESSSGYVNRGRYGGRYNHSGCIVDNGEYGGYGRYGPSSGCVVDNGEYGRYGRYGRPGGCIVDSSEFGPPPMGCIHQSNYAEPSRYMTNLSPYAAGMANAAVAVPSVVSPTFCVPYVAQFIVEQKVMTLSSGKFTIYDPQGRLLFEVENKFFGIHTKRILCDGKGIPLVLLKKMNLTLRDRWEAYRGEESNDDNLLFVLKKSSIYQVKPSYDIFMAANTAMSKPDFTLKGDLFQNNYTIFFHHTPVAEASRKINPQSVVAGKDQYGVTVFPGVDHAFIAALIVIVDQIQQDDSGTRK